MGIKPRNLQVMPIHTYLCITGEAQVRKKKTSESKFNWTYKRTEFLFLEGKIRKNLSLKLFLHNLWRNRSGDPPC